VLGHEIAHVVAHHPAERISSSIIALVGVGLISALFDISGQLPSILMNVLYSLPNSRTQEVRCVHIKIVQF
jgi:Zn-dependent protease with chaperone function